MIICSLSFAQTINGKAVNLKEYSNLKYDFIPLENQSDYFSAYIAPKTLSKKDFRHQLAIYNKNGRTITFKSLAITEEYYPISVFPAGDQNFGLFYNYERKTGFTIATAGIPLDAATTLNFKHRLTLPAKDLEWYAGQSPDGSKHAVVLISMTKKELPTCHVFIYDQTGDEMAYQSFVPQINGDEYEYQDVAISNNGEVTVLLLATGKKTGTALHIACITANNELTEYRIPPTAFGGIHSAKMLLLKNGKHFIGGYYGETDSKPSIGYFSYIFDPNTEDIVEEHHYALPSGQCAKNQIMLVMNFKYKILARNIFELDNGEIVMLGEHRAWCRCTQQTGNLTTVYYVNRASDIVYQHFNGEGESDSDNCKMIRKLQEVNSNRPPTMREMSWNTNHSYEDFGISYYAFQKGNDIYLVYNNNIEPDKECALNVLNYGKTCVRLTKIAGDGEVTKKVVMRCDTKKNFFQNVWMVDGDNVYFGTDGKPGYQIEGMSIE